MNVIRRALSPVKGGSGLMVIWKVFFAGMLCAVAAGQGVMMREFVLPVLETLYLCGGALIVLPVL